MSYNIENTRLSKLINRQRPKIILDFESFYMGLKKDIKSFQMKAPKKIHELKLLLIPNLTSIEHKVLMNKIEVLEYHLHYTEQDLTSISQKMEKTSIDGRYESLDDILNEVKEKYDYIHLI